MGNSAHLLSLAAKLQSYPVIAAYTEQGVECDGTQTLDAAGKIPDATDFLFFASYFTSVDGNQRLWSANTTTDSFGADVGGADSETTPIFNQTCDASGISLQPATAPALGARIHILVSGEVSGSDMVGNMVCWDATNGIQTDTDTALSATTFEFSTGTAANYRLLGRENNNGHNFEGTVYRLAMWTDLGGSLPDITSASVQNNFFSGASIVDPATSRTAYGTSDIEFDAYGNAATWNSGTLPTGSGFTVTGTVVDA